LFNNAPRYHSGLKTGEIAAILEQGEQVLTSRDQKGVKALAGAASSAFGQREPNIALTINAPNSTPDSVMMLKKQIPGIVLQTISSMNGRGG
jgi:hypothetical protein